MMTFKLASSTLAIVLLLAGTAGADQLFTPPLFAAAPNSNTACSIANVAGKDQVIRIQLIDQVGAVVDETAEFTLPAGWITELDTVGVAQGRYYCRFITDTGESNKYRTMMSIWGATAADAVALPGDPH